MPDDEHYLLATKLAAIEERVAGLAQHKAGSNDLSRLEQDFRAGDFRTLQQISGDLSNFKSDQREWTQNMVRASEERLLAAIKQNSSWQRNVPIYIALVVAILGILTGNPSFLRMLTGGAL